MDKNKYNDFHAAWKQFDRSTAYGCANRKIEFDQLACQRDWSNYLRVHKLYNVPYPTAPIGLTNE